MQKQRRDFLKIAAAGAAGLALARADRVFAAWPSTGSLAVNPTISNMRVVACVDPKMMTSIPALLNFTTENGAVDSARVQANMDAMAMSLANESTADAAWKAIFRSSKDWAATKVAIKVNTIEPKNMARIAVIEKFCKIMAGFGVPGANITIYDGNTTYGAGISNYNSYFSLTDTTKIQAVVSSYNNSMGGTAKAAIPGGTTANCTADIANGVTDILINIANNKGHTMMGKATLSMKNHFGTFAPDHDNNYVFNINKSDAILGGTPVRQQLCFIDSIIANKASNTGAPDVAPPCYLIMGVFAPAVDYLTVKKVREPVMGATHDAATITSYLTTFGYAETDPVWVVVPPASGGTNADGGTATGGTSGSGGAGSGGVSGSGGAGTGGTSASGGARSGGTSSSGGAGSGGTSASGGAGTGGANASGGARSGGGSASGGAGSGGASASGGAGSGGANATGGSTNGAASGGAGAGGVGGTATSAPSASGGSFATGGTSAGNGTAGSGVGGRTGTSQSTGPATKGDSGGCDIAASGRRTTRLGAMLALGAVVAEKLRRLVSGSDRSS